MSILFIFRKGFLNVDGLWSEKTLQEYFVHISSLKPKMTSNAQKILTRAFMYHRSRPDRHEERTTVRLMDSLVRYTIFCIYLFLNLICDLVDRIKPYFFLI